MVRIAAVSVFDQPVESDALSYFTMAEHLASGRPMQDQFGQFAFYSPGYPLLLGSIFAVSSATLLTALTLNIVLALVSCWLVHVIALKLSRSPLAAGLAAVGYALLIPAAFGATLVYKENLATPLLLAFVLCLLRFAEVPSWQRAWATGLSYGAGLLAGASSLLVAGVFGWALWRARDKWLSSLAAFAIGVALTLAPWLAHTRTVLGTPVLTTNSGFNLYLGNNPAADGRFVSIADTPAAPDWERMRKTLGEVGASAALGERAREWIVANPQQAAMLAVKKLGLFWAPNIPDAADVAADAKIAAARWFDVAQHLLILALALLALARSRRDSGVTTVALVIAAFWVVHALTYIFTRYRDPAMPLMLALAAMPVATWIEARRWPA